MNEQKRLKIRKLLELNKRVHSKSYVLLYSIVFFQAGIFCLIIGTLAKSSIYSIADIIGGICFLAAGYSYFRRFRKKVT